MTLEYHIKFACIVMSVVGFNLINGQSFNLRGKITDTLNEPMQNANVLALPSKKELSVQFSFTDENGNFKLSLNANEEYEIEVSFLGYKKIKSLVTLKSNFTKNFILEESTESLDEVIITQRAPVIVKVDTIIYRTEVFKTGEERKLKEVLKKLPGVEVDRYGNVKVNGKPIDELLIDGKPFFTGDEKLGVNNIPADIVDEVEVLDNYTEVAFLKGLSDSDKMALNIKLKEGRNKFMFGELVAGGGFEERYVANPTLFYYSPKTSVNAIVDVNNTGQKSFTVQDYIDFEGGFSQLVDKPQAINNMFSSEFVQSLQQQDLVFNQHRFGALSIDQEINKKLTLRAYSINSTDKNEALSVQNNLYFDNEMLIDNENRSTSANNETFSTLNKIMLKYNPSLDDDLKYEVIVKAFVGNSDQNITSNSLAQNNFIKTLGDGNSLKIAQTLEYNKRFSYKHTSTLNVDMTYNNSNQFRDWDFSQNNVNTILPLDGDAPYNILQDSDRKDFNASLNLKHYWIINNFNHIYPVAGIQFLGQNYATIDIQHLENETNNFQNAGFNNDSRFELMDSYFGFQYKAKAGNFTFKPGLIYHYYLWQVSQFDETQVTKAIPQLLPELRVDWKPDLMRSIRFQYNMQSSFQDISLFSDRLRLQRFNVVFQGNSTLENDLNHRLSLIYRSRSLARGIYFNAGVNYNRKFRSTQNSTVIDGINQITRPIYTELPEEIIAFNSSFSKKIKKLRLGLSARADFSNYVRLVNDNFVDYNSENYTYRASFSTNFKENPNVEIGFGQTFNSFSSDDFKNNFTQTNPYLAISYDFLDAFIFNADYRYTSFINKDQNTKNTFEISGVSLYYNKEDSPWGFEIEAINLLDAQSKNSNSFSEFIISENTVFIQPRTIVFKLSYKL